jgi:hypothetical protein
MDDDCGQEFFAGYLLEKTPWPENAVKPLFFSLLEIFFCNESLNQVRHHARDAAVEMHEVGEKHKSVLT